MFRKKLPQTIGLKYTASVYSVNSLNHFLIRIFTVKVSVAITARNLNPVFLFRNIYNFAGFETKQ